MSATTNSRMLGATIAGGIVGAGLALLFAPRSGQETREQIHQNFDDLKQNASDKLDEAKELTTRLKEAAHKTGKKAKTEMEELRDTTKKHTANRQSPVLSAWEEEV